MNQEEIYKGVASLPLLLRFNAGFAALVPRDVKGCARSFIAYGLASPAIILYLDAGIEGTIKDAAEAPMGITVDPGLMTVVTILSQIIQLAGFPVLLRVLLRAYRRLDRWAWLVSANNWLNAAGFVIVIAVSLFLGPLFQGAAQPFGRYLFLGLQLYLLVVEAFMAETILTVGGLGALGVVLLDFFFSNGVDATARWIATGSLLPL